MESVESRHPMNEIKLKNRNHESNNLNFSSNPSKYIFNAVFPGSINPGSGE